MQKPPKLTWILRRMEQVNSTSQQNTRPNKCILNIQVEFPQNNYKMKKIEKIRRIQDRTNREGITSFDFCAMSGGVHQSSVAMIHQRKDTLANYRNTPRFHAAKSNTCPICDGAY